MRIAGLLALCLGLAGCPVPQAQNTPVAPRLLTEPVTGGTYYLYVPTTYNQKKPAPLIVSCHGTDPFDVAAYQIGEWKMLAEQYGCILVCPKLTATDGILGDGPTDGLLRDERLIVSIIGQMHYLYRIDRKNVLITGFSGGGFPMFFLGLRHPDLFTALAARNCNFNRANVEDWYTPEALKTPVIVYYGQDDLGAIHDQSEAAVSYLRSLGFNVESQVIPGSGHERHPEVAMRFWLNHWNGPRPATRAP